MRTRCVLAPACPLRRIGAIANRDHLHRIANEIADHAHTAGLRQLHEHGDVGVMPPERRTIKERRA